MVMVSLLTFPSSSSQPIALYTQASSPNSSSISSKISSIVGHFFPFPLPFPLPFPFPLFLESDLPAGSVCSAHAARAEATLSATGLPAVQRYATSPELRQRPPSEYSENT